jgi:hypothetical protein
MRKSADEAKRQGKHRRAGEVEEIKEREEKLGQSPGLAQKCRLIVAEVKETLEGCDGEQDIALAA